MTDPMTQQRLDEIREAEEWRDVAGYEGRYRISSFGNVVSVSNRYKNVSPRKIKPRMDRRGYLVVSLRNGSRNITKSIHKLVAEQFISNASNKPMVNHMKEG